MIESNFIGSGFEKSIQKIIYKIYSHENLTFTNDKSGKRPSNYNPKSKNILINIKEHQNEPIKYIWNILHEYGHYRKKDNFTRNQLDKEVIAWNYAHQEIESFYPKLYEMKDDFYNHQNNCLNTYKRKHILEHFYNNQQVYISTEILFTEPHLKPQDIIEGLNYLTKQPSLIEKRNLIDEIDNPNTEFKITREFLLVITEILK